MSLSFPKIIGHRGARNLAPENTLAGMRAAHAHGVRYVEFDAKLTRDGVVILMHDETLDRTTDSVGLVAERDYADLAQVNAGKPIPGHGFEKIPTLAETIALLADLGMGANIEIKPCPGRERETAAAVVRTVRECWPPHLPVPLLSSFKRPALEEALSLAPDLPRGYLVEKLPANWSAEVKALACATLNLGVRDLSSEDAAAAVASGLPLLIWTVNNPDKAVDLLRAGAAGIITDRPDVVRG